MATRRSISDRSFQWAEGRTDVRCPKFAIRCVTTALAAGGGAVDEQAALCNNLLAGFQITFHLDEIAVDETGLDPAEFDRLVRMRYPDPDLVALIDQGLLRHGDRRVIAVGIDRDVGEHLRLQAAVLVLYRGADQKPAGRGIDRRGNIVDARRQRAARQRQHVESDLLPDRYVRRIGLADEGREPDRGEIPDHKYRIAGAGVHELAGADLALHHGTRDRRKDRCLRVDAAPFLKGRYGLVGEAEDSQFVARRLQRRLRRAQIVLRLDQGCLGLLIILQRDGLALEQILGAPVLYLREIERRPGLVERGHRRNEIVLR